MGVFGCLLKDHHHGSTSVEDAVIRGGGIGIRNGHAAAADNSTRNTNAPSGDDLSEGKQHTNWETERYMRASPPSRTVALHSRKLNKPMIPVVPTPQIQEIALLHKEGGWRLESGNAVWCIRVHAFESAKWKTF